MEQIKGVDLYHNDVNFDVHGLISEGIKFIALKATQGASEVDPDFKDRFNVCSTFMAQPNIVIVYHFFVPSDYPEAQADHFASTVGKLKPGQYIAVDLEDTPGWKGLTEYGSVSLVLRFVKRLKVQLGLTDKDIFIYGSIGWLRGQFGTYLRLLSDWKLWVARYGVEDPGDVSPWTVWTIWQNNEYGTDKYAGSAGSLDTDLWNQNVPFG